MGLDWNPGNKAKPGFEAEFVDVFRAIQATNPGETRDALLDRYHEISITAFETLQAPVVGRDPDADAWARQLHARLGRDEPEDQFLARLAGFAVPARLPPRPLPAQAPQCRGWPVTVNVAVSNTSVVAAVTECGSLLVHACAAKNDQRS